MRRRLFAFVLLFTALALGSVLRAQETETKPVLFLDIEETIRESFHDKDENGNWVKRDREGSEETDSRFVYYLRGYLRKQLKGADLEVKSLRKVRWKDDGIDKPDEARKKATYILTGTARFAHWKGDFYQADDHENYGFELSLSLLDAKGEEVWSYQEESEYGAARGGRKKVQGMAYGMAARWTAARLLHDVEGIRSRIPEDRAEKVQEWIKKQLDHLKSYEGAENGE